MAPPDGIPSIPGLEHTTLAYGPHDLQRVGVWQDPQVDASSDTWVFWIHGGAWRDPRRSPYDFVPTMQHIQASTHSAKSRIRGFASIDYRLSPHPLFPQDPAATPANEYRNARHPDHLNDVRAAVHLLISQHSISRFILVGHSAGSTLSYQLFMAPGPGATESTPVVPTPAGIIGVAGAYDLAGLCSRKEGYEVFMDSAFGDRSGWDAVSPAKFHGSFAGALADGRHVSMLAASEEDSLVDMPELDGMYAKLCGDGVDVVAVRDLTGDHDDSWQGGKQVADLILDMLARLS